MLRKLLLLLSAFLFAAPVWAQSATVHFGPTGDIFTQHPSVIKNDLYIKGNLTVVGSTKTASFPFLTLTGTNFNGILDVPAGLGQATTYLLADPGAATTNILTESGTTSAVTIQHVAVPLTAANLIAMYTTPVQLIAAGAAGTNIVVHHFMFTMNRTATAFTGGGVVAPQIGNTANGAGTLTTATIAASVVTTAGAATTYTTTIPVSYTGTAATGLFISNQTAAFAAGTGTAVADIWYSIK